MRPPDHHLHGSAICLSVAFVLRFTEPESIRIHLSIGQSLGQHIAIVVRLALRQPVGLGVVQYQPVSERITVSQPVGLGLTERQRF
jgi:hypothetical protein